ncbi:gliding motility-associated C-terminal domain-containing protein [Fibrella arboris]|uniref:T9SS type B sorting domain-containing protein n=1 Tax=Fibrella arboris TaxID=3242486 RepID=UPI00351FDF6B
MGNYLFITGLVIVCSFRTVGQSLDCRNIGFEEGTTRGWVLTNGSVTDVNQQTVYQNETAGTFENGHLITSAGNDPNVTAEAIPMVAPGSTHSLRIGNVTRGSRFDRIRGSFVVTTDNTLFQYRFAVVLQNPTHQPYQQPGFSIRITNQAGALLACSEYDVTAAANITGFKAQGDIRYRNWTTGAIDLRTYLGQTVTVEVTAHGCTERRHYGYAYFDAQCLKTEVTQALYCPGVDPSMTLKAPEGFATYAWNTGETTANIAIKPVQGATYSVTVTPYASLNSACQLSLDYTVKVGQPVAPTLHTATICEGDAYQVGNSFYQTAGTYLTAVKRGAQQCDSLVQTTLTVRPLLRRTRTVTVCDGDSIWIGGVAYRTAGTYQTRINQPDPLCDSLITTEVLVNPFKLTVAPVKLIRPGETGQLRAQVLASSGTTTFGWLPPNDLSCPACATTLARPTATTQYTVLADNAALGCRRTATVWLAVGSCILYAPEAFTPNRDGTNDVFFIPANACIRQINELTIYNRWGEVIYHCQNVAAGDPAAGWDGRYRGADCEPGEYVYKVQVDFQTDNPGSFQGRLLLIR